MKRNELNPKLLCPGCKCELVSDLMSALFGYCCVNEKCKIGITKPDIVWFCNGQFHREDGPAVEYANGSKRWYLNGLLHRVDGPAVEYVDGTKAWYINGKLQ